MVKIVFVAAKVAPAITSIMRRSLLRWPRSWPFGFVLWELESRSSQGEAVRELGRGDDYGPVIRTEVCMDRSVGQDTK